MRLFTLILLLLNSRLVDNNNSCLIHCNFVDSIQEEILWLYTYPCLNSLYHIVASEHLTAQKLCSSVGQKEVRWNKVWTVWKERRRLHFSYSNSPRVDELSRTKIILNPNDINIVCTLWGNSYTKLPNWRWSVSYLLMVWSLFDFGILKQCHGMKECFLLVLLNRVSICRPTTFIILYWSGVW